MAKTTKKTAKTAPARRARPMDLSARIKVLKKENPFREGTEVAKRAAAVLACGGKTVEAAVKKGARTSTVRWLRDHKIITVAA